MPVALPDPAAGTGAIEPVEDAPQVPAVDVLPRVGRFQEHEAAIGQADPAVLADLGRLERTDGTGLGCDEAIDLAARANSVNRLEDRIGPSIDRPRTAADEPVEYLAGPEACVAPPAPGPGDGAGPPSLLG